MQQSASFAATDMERGSVKWQGEAPVRIALGGRLVASSIVVGGERVVGDARQTDMRGLATAGRGVRQERIACLETSVAGLFRPGCS
jgi:hypothetical protein